MPIDQQPNSSQFLADVKHVPMRRCVLCRTPKPQTELIRFFKTEAGSWALDTYHLTKLKVIPKADTKLVKPEGRGTWVCFNAACHNPKKIAYNFKKQAEEIESHLKQYSISKNTTTGKDLNKNTENAKFQSGGMNV